MFTKWIRISQDILTLGRSGAESKNCHTPRGWLRLADNASDRTTGVPTLCRMDHNHLR